MASAAENGRLIAEAEALFREGRSQSSQLQFVDKQPNMDAPSRFLVLLAWRSMN